MTLPPKDIFTLEIDGHATVVFDAQSVEEARGICSLPEFRSDLSAVTARGVPVCDVGSILAVRRASAQETIIFTRAAANAAPNDGPTMAFLIEIDGVVVTIVDPE